MANLNIQTWIEDSRESKASHQRTTRMSSKVHYIKEMDSDSLVDKNDDDDNNNKGNKDNESARQAHTLRTSSRRISASTSDSKKKQNS